MEMQSTCICRNCYITSLDETSRITTLIIRTSSYLTVICYKSPNPEEPLARKTYPEALLRLSFVVQVQTACMQGQNGMHIVRHRLYQS
jgi:hypothetical protein